MTTKNYRGIYGIKPWWQERLAGLENRLVKWRIHPDLVTLAGVGCAGLMGLTRAWIGAGARSVLATRWDIPDEAGARIMIEFYRTFRAWPERGPAFALQQAQSGVLKSRVSANTAQVWGAYFVLGRE